jgi:hypothetical protein
MYIIPYVYMYIHRHKHRHTPKSQEIRGSEILLVHTKDMSFEDHLRVDFLQKQQLHKSKQYDQYFQTKEIYSKKHQQ